MKRLRLAILLFCGLSGCVTGKKEPVALVWAPVLVVAKERPIAPLQLVQATVV